MEVSICIRTAYRRVMTLSATGSIQQAGLTLSDVAGVRTVCHKLTTQCLTRHASPKQITDMFSALLPLMLAIMINLQYSYAAFTLSPVSMLV
jgi:hypothetical protein